MVSLLVERLLHLIIEIKNRSIRSFLPSKIEFDREAQRVKGSGPCKFSFFILNSFCKNMTYFLIGKYLAAFSSNYLWCTGS